jgi:hypothetical protein
MAKLFDDVRPGDLIEAAFINALALQVESLADRVTKLENAAAVTGPAVKISGVQGSQKIADVLEVDGLNFDSPVVLNQVFLDDLRIQDFNPTSAPPTRIDFNIPRGIAGVPKMVTLKVTNRFGTDSMPILILPEDQLPQGEMRVTPKFDPNLPKIVIGGTYNFDFEISSNTTVAETYHLDVGYASVVGATSQDWSGLTQLTTTAGQPLPQYLPLTPFAPVTVRVTVKVPDGAQSASLVFKVQSVHSPMEPLLNPQSLVPLAVGSAPPVSDPRVDVKLGTLGASSRAKLDPATGAILIPYAVAGAVPSPIALPFKVTFLNVGGVTFTYGAEFSPAAGAAWGDITVVPASRVRQQGETETVAVGVTLKATSAADNEARLLTVSASWVEAGKTVKSFVSVQIKGYAAA